MRAAREASMTISLTKSLSYCGVSRTAWYYVRRPRDLAIDGKMESLIMEVAKTRPTYGTRRVAAQLARQLGAPVNRKKVSRIYRKLEWTAPRMRKSEIIRSGRKLPRPVEPNQFWEADMSYIWCGGTGSAMPSTSLMSSPGSGWDSRLTRVPQGTPRSCRSPTPWQRASRIPAG